MPDDRADSVEEPLVDAPTAGPHEGEVGSDLTLGTSAIPPELQARFREDFSAFGIVEGAWIDADPFARLEAAPPDMASVPLAETQKMTPVPRGGDASTIQAGGPVESTEDHRDEDASSSSEVPRREPGPWYIDRYRVDRVLGQGGFGTVFLAWDDRLGRPVAIKVPKLNRVLGRGDLDVYLAEARILASLDHENILPVYDSGVTKDGLCFVVSKVVDGTNLSAAAGRLRSDYGAIAGLIASVADALHCAHAKGLVHRDVKPGNILLEAGGRPYLADFGLALRDEDFGRGPGYAGTPAYMSPEQARGEGHRVDRRSDIFSLGIVLYQLLTGRHPFGPGKPEVLAERIATGEARPPRQLDAAVPRELERICLRALAPRVLNRYETAREFAVDLRRFAAEHRTFPDGAPADVVHPELTPIPRDPARVMPKGLRSFDAEDADFFLDLLHGPRDRDGVPEVIRFWKTRIEARDPESSFQVGLLYGPSGCGKSSLVRAGLIPRLAPRIVPVYCEAADEFDDFLLAKVRGACPGLDRDLGLVETLTAIRRGRSPGPGAKVLIILDQFEQWLQANDGRPAASLVKALRQCDGRRLQALVLVREEFWMSSTRFMRDLEVRLEEGVNAAAVDLFTPAHARKVLTTFGRAYGALAEPIDESGGHFRAFLDLAVRELAEADKISPVRLALFAELVKGREWTPATVKRLGGAVGIGVTFLEETFSAPTAPPEHRQHEPAVRAVLKAVLPGPGEDIKGRARSADELCKAAEYARNSEAFDSLIRILDRDTRLLTPVASGHEYVARETASGPSYQLTHDYLVPSIREWLARKQGETLSGRAQQKLAERAAFWGAKPEPRQLPTLLEFAAIGALTDPRTWKPTELAMMGSAARRHLVHVGGLLALCATLVLGTLVARARWAAESIVRRVLDADIAQVPAIVPELRQYGRLADPMLRAVVDNSASDPGRRRHARLALLPADQSQVGPLVEEMLQAPPMVFSVLSKSLHPDGVLVDRLWDELRSPTGSPDRRFRAAAALAGFDPGSSNWDAHARFAAERLVQQPAILAREWVEAFRPIGDRLVGPLAELARGARPGRDRELTTEIFADYAAARPDMLVDLLGSAEPQEFDWLFARLESHAQGQAEVEGLLQSVPRDDSRGEVEAAAEKKASAAIALARIGRPEPLWNLLKAVPDPTIRSFLVHRIGPMGVDPTTLVDRLDREQDDDVRAAILLALGGYGEALLPPRRRDELSPRIIGLYRDHPDAAVHAAAGWLLRSWGRRSLLADLNRDLAGVVVQGREWRVNDLGLTMVAIPGPVRFMMGSPEGEAWRRDEHEDQHEVDIPHALEVSSTEVTVDQFRAFLKAAKEVMGKDYEQLLKGPADAPITSIRWYDAVRFCDWLTLHEGFKPDQRCYAPNEDGKYEEGMSWVRGFQDKLGYRLLTEAEWEYACRAGTTTSRPFGESDVLMADYGYYHMNSGARIHPTGELRPNAFGLFDMLGNAFEWCHDLDHTASRGGDGPDGRILDGTKRTARGGTALSHPRSLRSAARSGDVPKYSDYVGGFRVARSRPRTQIEARP